MTIPLDRLSTVPVVEPFLYWNDVPYKPYTDVEQGGRALKDPNEGVAYQTWTAYQLGTQVWLSSEDGQNEFIFDIGVQSKNLALAFNQNADYLIAWEDGDDVKMHWFDTVLGDYVVWVEPNAYAPALTLDDHRAFNVGASDVLFAYARGQTMYYRMQRERFGVERELMTLPAGFIGFGRCGMNTGLRVQWELIVGSLFPCSEWEDELGPGEGENPGVDWDGCRAPVGTPWPPCPGSPVGSYLLLQSGERLLLQSGDYLLLQD